MSRVLGQQFMDAAEDEEGYVDIGHWRIPGMAWSPEGSERDETERRVPFSARWLHGA